MKLQLLILLIGLTAIEADTKNDSKSDQETIQSYFDKAINETVVADYIHGVLRKLYSALGHDVTDDFLTEMEGYWAILFEKILDNEHIKKHIWKIGEGGRSDAKYLAKDPYELTDVLSYLLQLNLRVLDIDDKVIDEEFSSFFQQLISGVAIISKIDEEIVAEYFERLLKYSIELEAEMDHAYKLSLIDPKLPYYELEMKKNVANAYLKTFNECCERCIEEIGKCCDYCNFTEFSEFSELI